MPVDHVQRDARRLESLLVCGRCELAVPVVAGYPILLDVIDGVPGPDDTVPRLEEARARWIGTAEAHADFLHAKRRRPSHDLYAAFRPFNESSRALEPLVPLLREHLRPGERILDLWCRTGWTGEWLAARFPDNPVVSVWESASDVLGTRGFAHHLGAHRRLPNLDVVFHDPAQPLPFADRAFGAVHALDTLHRYPADPFVGEVVRVARPDAVLALPHVHLTNAEPDPFFERGGVQRPGSAYAPLFAPHLEGDGRRVFVLSERRLYEECAGTELVDEPDTTHYNAAVVVAPASEEGRTLAREVAPPGPREAWRAARNPLVQVDLSTGRVAVDRDALFGGVGDMLDRHPPHAARLERVLPEQIDVQARRLLYWAERGACAGEVAVRTGTSVDTVAEGWLALEAQELLQVQPVSEAMARLQDMFTTQRIRPAATEATVPALWDAAVRRHPEATYVEWAEDASAFTYETIDALSLQVAGALRAAGVGRGDRVWLDAVPHPEYVLAMLGALRLGAIVASIDPTLGPGRRDEVRASLAPTFVIGRPTTMRELGLPGWQLEDAAPEPGVPEFQETVLDAVPAEGLPLLSSDDPAMVLFTSGSTGRPKGVLLSQGGLVRSSEVVDRVFAWTAEDRFHCPGTPHTMSAFRNAFLTPLHAGARVVLAPEAGPMDVLTTCLERGVTILNTTPAFLTYAVRLGNRPELLRGHRIRQVLCTGSALQPGLRERFESLTGARVHDYYGLTETSGACTFVGEVERNLPEPGIGAPVETRVTVVDAAGDEVPEGATGELVLETENLALGYVTPQGVTPIEAVRDGQLFTGDLVRRTPDGCLHLVGRNDRMLVDRSGENLHPEEIERALDAQPGVATSHVTARHRDGWAEIVALVVADHDVDSGGATWVQDLLDGLRRVLAPAHVPAHLIEVDEPPIEAAGVWNPDAVEAILDLHLPGSRS